MTIGLDEEKIDPLDDTGFKNELVELSDEQIFANIQALQQQNNIKQSGSLGEYGTMFEEEYLSVLNNYTTLFDTPYQKYLKEQCCDVSAVHKGYFSIDKKGHAVDSATKRGSEFSDDISAYDLKGMVKHIYFIAETKGTMETLSLRPIEQAKISCAKKLFNELSTDDVVYHDVDSYQNLLNIMNSI